MAVASETKRTAMNEILDKLEGIVATARSHSQQFEQKVNSLSEPDPQPDGEGKSENDRQGILHSINRHLESLTYINERNNETLNKLDNLI